MPKRTPLHPPSSLSKAKLQAMRKSSTERILKSLEPGQPNALKVRKDGVIMEGHHRIVVLQERGIDIDMLECEEVD